MNLVLIAPLIQFVLALVAAGFPAPAFHLVSGEEFEAEVLSLHEKHVVAGIGDSVTRLIPYDRIAAIRFGGKLHTEGLDRSGLVKLFPALQPAGQAAGVPGSDSGPAEADREPETAPSVSPEGRYLTFQGLASVPALRPVISFNHEWTTRHPLHITSSLHFEMGGPPADPAFRGEKIGLGAKAGVRKYFLGKQGWYLEGDLGGFHFFNGMLGRNRSYFGTGPHLGYKTRIEQVVLDANIGWMHVFNEPQVYPRLQGTGEDVIDRHLRILEWTSGWSIRNAYPLMRFEANFALGFKL